MTIMLFLNSLFSYNLQKISMAAALVKKVLSRFIGVKVLDVGGVKFFSNEKNLVKKARRGRHRCMLHTPTDEKAAKTHFDSAKALIKHIEKVHHIKKPGDESEDIFCQQCGNLKSMEDECQFLAPHQHPCPASAKMTKAQTEAILVQQYRDRKE